MKLLFTIMFVANAVHAALAFATGNYVQGVAFAAFSLSFGLFSNSLTIPPTNNDK